MLCPVSLFAQVPATASIAVFEDHDKYIEASRSYGTAWGLIKLAADHQGIALQPQSTSWSAAMNRLQAQRVHLIFGAFQTAERQAWGTFSLPLSEEGSAIFTTPDNPIDRIDDIDMATATIGVSANSVQDEIARELGFVNVYASTARPQLYSMLEEGRLDYLLFGQSIVAYYCANFTATPHEACMKQIGPALLPSWVRVMAASDNRIAKQLIASLNEGLMAIRHTQAARDIFSKYPNAALRHKQWLTQLKQEAGSLPH
ncbi:transporter substrate-binding domain-containing protein [Alteromonas sp. ASW11-19]|uniref:Transporter substrate-binding domain-containing protein n=1 Tax=Alteromonas salexigens TaxID=2982530 RepID=A0ABT2VIW1_9ALTE|nr:transporter substrate-binding domain-containing protein [Alteromonas salexigens]